MSFSLFSRIVHRVISPISGEIIVREQLGRHSLYVGGIPQSGGIVRGIWKKAIRILPVLKPSGRVLLLGLGGGSVVHLLKDKYPRLKILGVEIDPQIVVVARTYFGLDEVSGLEIMIEDAFKVVSGRRRLPEGKNFDLVLVDIYLGKDLPEFVRERDFIKDLKGLLGKKGILVFNYLLDKEGKETIQAFEESLKKIFPRIRILRTASNELLFAYQG